MKLFARRHGSSTAKIDGAVITPAADQPGVGKGAGTFTTATGHVDEVSVLRYEIVANYGGGVIRRSPTNETRSSKWSPRLNRESSSPARGQHTSLPRRLRFGGAEVPLESGRTATRQTKPRDF